MTMLHIMADYTSTEILRHTRDDDEIFKALDECSVGLQRWPLRGLVKPGATSDDVLALYRAEVDELRERESMRLVDVVRMHPEDTPQWQEKAAKARRTYLEEHRHDEDEVRFFAHGSGCFYLHVLGRVYAVVCEAGDLLSVPAGTPHWFDMGSRPEFCAIRFFQKEDGWVGDFTGDPIARSFPHLDALLAPER